MPKIVSSKSFQTSLDAILCDLFALTFSFHLASFFVKILFLVSSFSRSVHLQLEFPFEWIVSPVTTSIGCRRKRLWRRSCVSAIAVTHIHVRNLPLRWSAHEQNEQEHICGGSLPPILMILKYIKQAKVDMRLT